MRKAEQVSLHLRAFVAVALVSFVKETQTIQLEKVSYIL